MLLMFVASRCLILFNSVYELKMITFFLCFRTSLEQLRQEITKLFNQVNKIQNQMKNPKTQKDVQAQMSDFLPVSFLDVMK